jgi:lysophospholipase L1-like esterase
MRKNKLFVIALLGYSVITLTSCAKREIKNIDSKGANIICFGDSITFGYGAGTGEDYPSNLAKLIYLPVVNAGVDGDISEQALNRIKINVLEKDPLLVIIEFCGNDFLKKVPFETTRDNISKMIDRIQARGAMVAVADISAGMFLAEYRKAFYRLAKEKDAIFIPHILSGIITNPSMKSDFLHPNAKGYKMIAERVYGVILPYLNRNATLRKPQK